MALPETPVGRGALPCANTAIFNVINAVLIRPLPYSDPSSLVYLKYDHERIGITPYAVALEFVAWRNQSRTLAQLGAHMESQGNLTGGGEAERVDYGFVTSSFFPMLGVQPMLGRNFTPEEDRPGGQPAMILSHNLWKRNFGGDPSIVGKAAVLDGKSYAIVGVLSPTFQLAGRYGGDAADLWMPFAINEADGMTLRAMPLRAVGRLKPGVSLERARAELDTILQSTISKRTPTKKRLILTPWHEEVAGGVKVPLLVFLAAVGFVLLIACVNVANLLLARAAARQKEIAIRRAVGAGRTRIVRQLLTESVLMALLGGTIGLAVAYWGKDLLVSFISTNLPAMSPVEMDYRVLAFNLGLAFLTGLAFGLAPALQASGIRLNESLKGNRPAIEGRVHKRLSTLLVVSEIALALVLLVGAGLLMKSFIRLRSVDPGFRSDQILSLTIDLTPSAYPHSRDQIAFFQQVTERIKALPRVEAVGLNACLPLSGHYMLMTGVTVEGRPPESDETFSPIYFTTVNSEYFRAVNIPLLRGRFFTESDAGDAPGVAIIDDTFARRYFPGEDPIGKQMKTPFQRNEILTIVGVVGNVWSTGLEKEDRYSTGNRSLITPPLHPEEALMRVNRKAILLGALIVVLAGVALGWPTIKRWGYEGLGRDRWQQPEKVIESLGISEGSRVADLGCGGGYFTFRLAEAVGSAGKVYAVDVDDDMTEYVAEQTRERGYGNVEAILARYDDPLLPNSGTDLIFTANTYHHIENRATYFRNVRKYLGPGGRIAVIEYNGKGWFGRILDHWTDRGRIVAEMEEAGYRLEWEFDFLPKQHFLIFRPAR